jgi:hypothetical protein
MAQTTRNTYSKITNFITQNEKGENEAGSRNGRGMAEWRNWIPFIEVGFEVEQNPNQSQIKGRRETKQTETRNESEQMRSERESSLYKSQLTAHFGSKPLCSYQIDPIQLISTWLKNILAFGLLFRNKTLRSI